MPEYDGRFELEWRYNVTIGTKILTHSHTFDVHMDGDQPVGEPFESYGLLTKSGADIPLGDFVIDYADVWSPLLGVGTALEEIILWKYDPEPSQAKIFAASASLLPTLSLEALPVAAQGAIFTFRQLGYRYPMRMYIMEGNQAGEERYPSSAFGTFNLEYKNYVIGGTSPIWGRADVPPVAGIALNLGQNEKLRDLRYRTA